MNVKIPKIKINGKKLFFIAVILLIIILSIVVWSYINADEEVINNVQEIIPSEEITDEQLRSTSISLYFINKETGEIEVECKRIDSKKLLENPYNEILNLWIQGANSEKLTTGCSEELKINKIEINKNCAVVDFSEEFLKKINNENISELKIIYCVVDTLTELMEIDSVKILINGQENIYFGNINLSEEYYRLSE